MLIQTSSYLRYKMKVEVIDETSNFIALEIPEGIFSSSNPTTKFINFLQDLRDEGFVLVSILGTVAFCEKTICSTSVKSMV